MTDETTPLTAAASSSGYVALPPYQGPTYVFPGGVSPRARRSKMKQFQCCMTVTFVVIVIAALCLALWLSGSGYGRGEDSDGENSPSFFFLTNESSVIETLAATKRPIPDEPEADWALRHETLDPKEGAQAVSAGIKALGDREILEEGLQPSAINTPQYRHYRSLSTNPEARKLARRGYVENHATLEIAQRFNYTKEPGRSNIGLGPAIVLPDPTVLRLDCDFNERFRRSTGVCNNKDHPRTYGASMVPYRRMVAPDYADGIAAPRASHHGQLPPARQVSLSIHRSSYETDSNFTVMLAVFGQFLDHDITATSLTTAQEGDSIDCCAARTEEPHPECFPVHILPNDPYYQHYNLSCMNFVRSAPAPTGRFGPRQQFNQATAFIDGSVVYGNLEQRQRQLRTYINGTLRMFITEDERELLPISSNSEDGCNRVLMTRQGKYCFESGDDRANENLLLTSMHLLWARQHNYLARGLHKLNPDWEDERIFQEARKIVGAQLAHITYNEFLPVLLGRNLSQAKGLLPASDNLNAPDTYDHRVNPSIANCFAGAAFRFAHTLLPGLFNVSRDNSTPEAMELHKMLFNPFSLWSRHGIDHALLAAANTPVLRVDRFFSLEITQKLFEGTAEDKVPVCGLDLVSLNIQRGRDHGIPAYPVFRRHCGLPPVDTWEQMALAVDNATLVSIKQIYDSPQDVDVYTGALSEPPLDGAIFGPLLSCLVSDQFMRIKLGDSHWYERKFGPQRFTKPQLAEIYKSSLAAIICRNSDGIHEIREHVMERHRSNGNRYVNCEDLPGFEFDFEPWSEAKQAPKLHKASFSQPMSLVRVMEPIWRGNHTNNHGMGVIPAANQSKST
ncbi:LOW QUALITY PROTEIN: chorion peroxidase [Drosophila sulfurigaster albostrigata]|uniref:LOW QUALITY PROTEIN: chorion peroxidase n=1 Tax=Drosophila sulfurigaster albostrigata TaxID=89887 RepID=UPI002D21C7A5|nr:LOW QUALITY PROTEIN: chorion peroxidase [Drosophila sulfurigaster albostrigata]